MIAIEHVVDEDDPLAGHVNGDVPALAGDHVEGAAYRL